MIVGVLPRSFRGTELFLNPDVYVPISTWLTMNPSERVVLDRVGARNLEVFGRALFLAGAGIAGGVALALASAHVLASVLYGVSAHDPIVFAASIGTMIVVAASAAVIPARRAVRVDPARSLRGL